MKKNARNNAEVLWEYMLLHTSPTSADILLVLGSNDERVAVRAAELTKEYKYGTVCFTGGVAHENDLLRPSWDQSEAEYFRNVFTKCGGRAHSVVVENRAKNTGENARFAYERLVKEKSLPCTSIQIVTKPFMERRAKATFEAQWPAAGTTFLVTSPAISLDDYPDQEAIVHVMVGDFERILTYPKLGYQTEQKVPVHVLGAWKKLIDCGYTMHMLSTK